MNKFSRCSPLDTNRPDRKLHTTTEINLIRLIVVVITVIVGGESMENI